MKKLTTNEKEDDIRQRMVDGAAQRWLKARRRKQRIDGRLVPDGIDIEEHLQAIANEVLGLGLTWGDLESMSPKKAIALSNLISTLRLWVKQTK